MHISSKKKSVESSEKITAAVRITDENDLREVLMAEMEADDCESVVNYAVSKDGTFQDEEFFDSYTFWDIYSNDSAEEMVKAFYEGDDLDSNERHANPDRDYFRMDATYGSIESTNDPGEFYKDEMLDDIVEYIIDNIDYVNSMDLSDEIMEIIDNYRGYMDSDEEDDTDVGEE